MRTLSHCPHCGEEVQGATTTCGYCGRMFQREWNDVAAKWDQFVAQLESLSPAERAQATRGLTPTQQEYLKSHLDLSPPEEDAATEESGWKVYIDYYSGLGTFAKLKAWHALTLEQQQTLKETHHLLPPIDLKSYGIKLQEVGKAVGCMIGLLLAFRILYAIPQEYFYGGETLDPVESVTFWISILAATDGLLIYWALFRWGQCKKCKGLRKALRPKTKDEDSFTLLDLSRETEFKTSYPTPFSIWLTKIFIGFLVVFATLAAMNILLNDLRFTELRVLATGLLILGMVLGCVVYNQVSECLGCKELRDLILDRSFCVSSSDSSVSSLSTPRNNN